MKKTEQLKLYDSIVSDKYHVYNSLFMKLPFDRISNTGILIPILQYECKKGYQQGLSPTEILQLFFKRQSELETIETQFAFMFRVVQYVERQVVLFDSIEDAAYTDLSAHSRYIRIEDIVKRAKNEHVTEKLKEQLQHFGVRYVFTAHPTQFYPSTVQWIIHELHRYVSEDSIADISQLLAQLGRTSFINSDKPTPLDEAKSIIYYLRHVYYEAVGTLFAHLMDEIFTETEQPNTASFLADIITLGFWPGGDRDGNPFVHADTTLAVANELRMTLFKCYYNHLKDLRNRLTFKGVIEPLEALSDRLYAAMFDATIILEQEDIIDPILEAYKMLQHDYEGLFLDELQGFLNRVHIFKRHFATLDIRQDARKHQHVIDTILQQYNLLEGSMTDLPQGERLALLLNPSRVIEATDFEEVLVRDTIQNIQQIATIQRSNGSQGCNRYIISNTEDKYAVLNVLGLFLWCGYALDEVPVDIVPLFETMTGMNESSSIMDELMSVSAYAKHVEQRNMHQTIMLGFSDGTKDGGYLKANWEILKTKEGLTSWAKRHDVAVIFFDGRGGPPARGGGKSHRFYAAQGNGVESEQIQLTIQGQTISSMYGDVDQFMGNCEQLITAGLTNVLNALAGNSSATPPSLRKTMDDLAAYSYEKYQSLKNDPLFVPYLEEKSTLKYYGMANIGSRPAKRGNSTKLTLEDLRAISFVSSWSLLKQNVPGYYGIGTAIERLVKEGRGEEVHALYKEAPFFKALLLNSMMSMSKTFFPLTAHMADNPTYGQFWKMLKDEFELSKAMSLEVSGYKVLMEEEPISKTSIQHRENIVLPLLTIQQYALQQLESDSPHKATYEKLVIRCLFGNINASRNSA